MWIHIIMLRSLEQFNLIVNLKKMIPSDFDWQKYLIINPDVAKAKCTREFAHQHWLQYGKNEGRSYRSTDIPTFDWNFYVTYYSDLNHLSTPELALNHYIMHGRSENRICNNQMIPLSANQSSPIILIITHTWGGGSEYFYQQLINHGSSFRFVTLRNHQTGHQAKLHIPWQGQIHIQSIDDNHTRTLLKNLPVKLIFVNQIVSYPIPSIIRLIYDLNVPYVITLHDGYYVYSDLQSYTKKHPHGVDQMFSNLLQKAALLTAPSETITRLYHTHIPSLKITMIPHEVLTFGSPLSVKKRSLPLLVGIIGTINTPGKGLDTIIDCANLAHNHHLPLKFIVFGQLTKPSPHVKVTGRYSSSTELFSRIQQYQPHMLWIPGLYLESYCYVLSLILLSTLPCAFPDISIYRERTKGFIGCNLYPPTLTQHQINQQLLTYYDQLPDPFQVTQVKLTHSFNPNYLTALDEVLQT
jgi:glycosyltransferase involved in cell wall biosynthesis